MKQGGQQSHSVGHCAKLSTYYIYGVPKGYARCSTAKALVQIKAACRILETEYVASSWTT